MFTWPAEATTASNGGEVEVLSTCQSDVRVKILVGLSEVLDCFLTMWTNDSIEILSSSGKP
jgi:hypothetical protein